MIFVEEEIGFVTQLPLAHPSNLVIAVLGQRSHH